MLPKKHRLRKQKEFEGVFRNRQNIREDGLLLKLGPAFSSVPRFGLVVSKKVAKQAVRRNRIRRVLSEVLAKELGSLKKNKDAVLMVLPGFKLPPIEDLKKKIHRLLEKSFFLL